MFLRENRRLEVCDKRYAAIGTKERGRNYWKENLDSLNKGDEMLELW